MVFYFNNIINIVIKTTVNNISKMVKKLMDKFYMKSTKISKKVLKMFSRCYIIILETIPKCFPKRLLMNNR